MFVSTQKNPTVDIGTRSDVNNSTGTATQQRLRLGEESAQCERRLTARRRAKRQQRRAVNPPTTGCYNSIIPPPDSQAAF